MQDHRSPRWPTAIADPGTPAFEDQRLVLLEILVDPPDEGDSLLELSRTLERSYLRVESAAAALCKAGLARRADDRLVATDAAVALEALWPIAL